MSKSLSFIYALIFVGIALSIYFLQDSRHLEFPMDDDKQLSPIYLGDGEEKAGLYEDSDPLDIFRTDFEKGFAVKLQRPIEYPELEPVSSKVWESFSAPLLAVAPAQKVDLIIPSEQEILVAHLPELVFIESDLPVVEQQILEAKVYVHEGKESVDLGLEKSEVYKALPLLDGQGIDNFTRIQARYKGERWLVSVRQSCGVAALDSLALRKVYKHFFHLEILSQLHQTEMKKKAFIDLEWRPIYRVP